MTVDEVIKYCEEKAEDKRRIAELCKNTRPYEDGWSFWENGAEKYSQIADWLKELKNIHSAGSCNECKSRGMCEYEPEAGQMTRFNCPFYKEERISKMTYGDIYEQFCKKFPKAKVNDLSEE